jgi:twinkle protein
MREFYSDYGIEIPTNNGGEVRTICPQCTPDRKPQHQREKDLCVNIDKGTWVCQHCDWRGSLKDPDKNAQNSDSKTYVKPAYSPSALPDAVIKYFDNRKISAETLSKCKIGFEKPNGKPHGAIMFPRYKHGEVVAIKYRTGTKQMWQSKNPEPCFYNYDMAAASGSNKLIITEGEIDCLSFVECGFENAASVPDGAPAVSAKNLDTKMAFLQDGLVDKFETFILAVDNDEPGKHLEEELAERLGKHKCCRVVYPSGCKDANDVLKKYGPDRLSDIYHQAKPYPVDGLYTVNDIEAEIIGLYDEGLRPGELTGWASLDRLYTVRKCEMTVVTGIPSSGKSTWLDALTVNLASRSNWKIAYCSPENWPIQRHAASLVEKITRKPFAGSTRTSDRVELREIQNALEWMKTRFFFTQLRDKDMHIDGILEVMQAAISRHGVDGVVLDPWNELEYHRPSSMSETEYVSESLGKIRRFARLNNVHVWIVAHPTKLKRDDTGAYPVPRLYDISGSAHWYNKADNGVVVHRHNVERPEVCIYVQKIRFREVGKVGDTMLRYIADNGRYKDLPADERVKYCKHNDDIFNDDERSQ